jgi:DNA-binding NtrC family response regulator
MEQLSSPRVPIVLVIDDDRVIREIVQKVLSTMRESMELVLLTNSQEGLDFLSKEKVGLLLVDLTGPGIMPLRQFKSALATTPNSDTHLVVMSGQTLDDTAYRDFDTLQKPFDMQGLREKVKSGLGIKDELA